MGVLGLWDCEFVIVTIVSEFVFVRGFDYVLFVRLVREFEYG